MNCKLSINVNKIALLRNSRGENTPNLLSVSEDIINFGGNGITVHPRPDERHITYADLQPLRELTQIKGVEFNIEGYPSNKFLDTIYEVQPDQVTLVPDPPEAITSSDGWDVEKHFSFLKNVILMLKKSNIRSSIFIDVEKVNIEAIKDLGTDRVELYTYYFAHKFPENKSQAIEKYVEVSERISEIEVGINAGHDLNLLNTNYFVSNIPNLLEVSIGHALISDALYYGLQNTISLYARRVRESFMYGVEKF